MKKIGVLSGPNLNRLGKREVGIYGNSGLEELYALLEIKASNCDVELDFFQSNIEGELIDKIYSWQDGGFDGVIINPAAYTHTSVALRDAIASCDMDFVEVHISNIYKREDFRHKSMTAPVCKASIAGMGFDGYCFALEFLSK